MFSLNSVTNILVTAVPYELATQPPLMQETRVIPHHQQDTCSRSLHSTQFMRQWFIRLPELSEFSEFLFYLGKTPFAIARYAMFRRQQATHTLMYLDETPLLTHASSTAYPKIIDKRSVYTGPKLVYSYNWSGRAKLSPKKYKGFLYWSKWWINL